MDVPVEGKKQGKGMFRDSVRRIRGNPHDMDLVLICGSKIDVVIARASKEDGMDAEFR